MRQSVLGYKEEVKLLSECRLYTFVDTAYLHGRSPEEVARQLCAGGSDLIQLRAKGSPPAEVRRMAEAILPITRAAGVGLVINDHLAVAVEVGAELCHLGQEDFFDTGRTRVGELFAESAGGEVPPGGGSRVFVGLSTHAPEQAGRGRRTSPSGRSMPPAPSRQRGR